MVWFTLSNRVLRPGALGFLTAMLALSPADACAQDLKVSPPQTIFESSAEVGCLKTPAIAGNGAGVLVAAAEQRFGTFRYLPFEAMRLGALGMGSSGASFGCGDWGFSNIVYRRSSDGGKTWSDIRLLVDLRRFLAGDVRAAFAGNPTLTWHPGAKRFVLLFVVSTSAERDNSASCVRAQNRPVAKCTSSEPARMTVYSILSEDLGATWSEPSLVPAPADLPPLVRPGPGHGSVLPDGRMVAPAYPRLLVSDDQGRSWRFAADHNRPRLSGSETALVPLDDGDLWSLTRMAPRDLKRLSRTSSVPHWLIEGRSKDRGETYASLAATSRFPIPMVQTSLALAKRGDGRPVVALSGPFASEALRIGAALPEMRRNLMVAVASDPERGAFSAAIVHDGPVAYSDLVALADGSVGVLYEGLESDAPDRTPGTFIDKVLFRVVDVDSILACASANPDRRAPAGPGGCFSF